MTKQLLINGIEMLKIDEINKMLNLNEIQK